MAQLADSAGSRPDNTAGATIALYGYNGLGQRVTTEDTGNPQTQLYYDASDQLLESHVANSGLSLQSSYIWSAGSGYQNALVLRDFDFSGNGVIALDERDYALQDANWNVTALVGYQPSTADANADGTVDSADYAILLANDGHRVAGGAAVGDFNDDGTVDNSDLVTLLTHYGDTGTGTWQLEERLVYSPYGVFTAYTPSFTVRSNGDFLALNVTFQGMLYDPATKLNFTMTRVYEASTGRFLTVDPAHADGMDWYRGDGSNPVTYLDPSGLALFAFDGTANYTNPGKPSDTLDGGGGTNVAKMYQAYTGPDRHYYGGVGNSREYDLTWVDKGTGWGAQSIIDTAMKNLENDWSRGDHDIDIIGFSRGAAEALEFANEIAENTDHGCGCFPGAKIRFIGLFDVVGSFGLEPLLDGKNEANNGVVPSGSMYKRLSLPTGITIMRASQAIAYSEHRAQFPWTNVVGANQLLFKGAHSDVGGGYDDTGLSNISLKWMIQQGQGIGAPFNNMWKDAPIAWAMTPHTELQGWGNQMYDYSQRAFPSGMMMWTPYGPRNPSTLPASFIDPEANPS